MKIAIFSDTFPPQVNGVANVVYSSAQELGRMGHEVYVFTVSNGFRQKRNTIVSEEAPKFTLIRLPAISAIAYPDQRMAIPLGLAINKLRKIRPDIIHTHTPFAVGWEAVWGAKFFNIPIVGTHHTFFDHYLKHVKLDFSWAKKVSWRYVVAYYNRCDLVLSPSCALAEGFIKHGLKKPVMVLPNAVDTDLFKPAKESKKIKKSLVYMGRLSYEKNIDQLIQATAFTVKKIPDIKLTLIGGGPEQKKLEKLTEKLNIKDNVIFAGFRRGQELAEALRAADIFVTASTSENMPLSVMEAMAAGLPVIGANALGIPELVKDGVNGFLSAPNDPADIAEKILKLIENHESLEKFSSAARKMSLEYSLESIGKLLEQAYTDLIKQKK